MLSSTRYPEKEHRPAVSVVLEDGRGGEPDKEWKGLVICEMTSMCIVIDAECVMLEDNPNACT
jgi:hypothetical protein